MILASDVFLPHTSLGYLTFYCPLKVNNTSLCTFLFLLLFSFSSLSLAFSPTHTLQYTVYLKIYSLLLSPLYSTSSLVSFSSFRYLFPPSIPCLTSLFLFYLSLLLSSTFLQAFSLQYFHLSLSLFVFSLSVSPLLLYHPDIIFLS